jgi:hypothetical protein
MEMKTILPNDSAPYNLHDKELKSRKIRAIFLPSTTSICQPIDQGIIETMNTNTTVDLFSY